MISQNREFNLWGVYTIQQTSSISTYILNTLLDRVNTLLCYS